MSKGIYYGVAGKARRVKAIYFGVAGKARRVKRVYVGVGNIARLVYDADEAAAASLAAAQKNDGKTTAK